MGAHTAGRSKQSGVSQGRYGCGKCLDIKREFEERIYIYSKTIKIQRTHTILLPQLHATNAENNLLTTLCWVLLCDV